MAATVPPTDEELDALILVRLRLIGIDLSVLPADDPNAPADQRRVLSSTRSILRTTVPTISDYLPDVQLHAPAMYPAALTKWTEEEGGRKSLSERRRALGWD